VFGFRRIEDLKLKTILQATDFQTGEGVGLETGDLADCVYASSAIYPLLPAIKIGKRWLFDGNFSAPIPVLQAVRHRPDIIIVVDFHEKLSPDPKGYFETTVHTGKIYARTIKAAQTCLTLNLHEGELIYMKMNFEKYITMWEVEKMPAILEVGEAALDRVKDEILLAINNHHQPARPDDGKRTRNT
jgi:NTE family protein